MGWSAGFKSRQEKKIFLLNDGRHMNVSKTLSAPIANQPVFIYLSLVYNVLHQRRFVVTSPSALKSRKYFSVITMYGVKTYFT